jgi:hypothetical protein
MTAGNRNAHMTNRVSHTKDRLASPGGTTVPMALLA